MIRTKSLLLPLVVALALGITACTPGVPSGGGQVDNGDSPQEVISDNTGSLDSDGFVIPGEVVTLELGDSVAYYSMPKLTLDDAQRVTIHSVEYIEKSDLGAGAPLDKIESGVLVISLTWESVKGRVQSNQGYLIAELDSGEKGTPFAFREDRLRNGRVPDGESQTGTFTIALERGLTTLTLEDYVGVPVAKWRVDTRN